MHSSDNPARSFDAFFGAIEQFEARAGNLEQSHWQFEAIDAWPVIRSIFLARAERALILPNYRFGLAERPNPTPFGYGHAMRNLKQSVVSNVVMSRARLKRATATHPDDVASADIIAIGQETSAHMSGGVRYHPELDWMLSGFAEAGYSTRKLLFGEPTAGADALVADSQNVQAFLLKTLQGADYPAPRFSKLGGLIAQLGEILPTAQFYQPSQIRQILNGVSKLAEAFKTVWKLSKPNAIILGNYYNSIGWACCVAGRALDIPVIELQHGHQGPRHHAFSAVPSQMHFNTLPRLFVQWSDKEAASTGLASEYIPAGPLKCRFTARVLSGVATHGWAPDVADCLRATFEADFDAAQSFRAHHKETPLILVTSQGGEAEGFIQSVADRVDGRARLIWRAHPLSKPDTDDRILADLKDRGVTVAGIADGPLSAVLPVCDAHLTGYSSTALEATEFGVRSVVDPVAGPMLLGYSADIEVPSVNKSPMDDMVECAVIIAEDAHARRADTNASARLYEIEGRYASSADCANSLLALQTSVTGA